MNDQPTPDPAFEALLDYLKRSRGFDFTGYKRASLERRVQKRMQEAGLSDYTGYMDHLEVDPDEFTLLFNTILINVTSFFRDPECWEFLASTILPNILKAKPAGDPIRIWSAGCASGEEAYSIAMVWAEALGLSEFRRRVKIYATDLDEEALGEARRAIFSRASLKGVSSERIDAFFERSGNRFMFRPELRRSVIFGRHDLVKDAPMSRLDLIVCRNVLMYLNAQTQRSVYSRFHFALNPGGFLFLGRAEMILLHADLFTPIDLKHRIFSKRTLTARLEPVAPKAEAEPLVGQDHLIDELSLRAGAFDALPMAQLVIDAESRLALANRSARESFNLQDADLGRLIQDLEISYRPVELRSLIDRAYQEAQTIRVAGVERLQDAGRQIFEVEVAPLRREGGAVLGASISFLETTAYHSLQDDLLSSRSRLEETTQAYHSATEELETTNEELQSTNEELETTNEELQSSNEELETMNEELQSTNEQLRTMNEVLQERTHEIDDTNAFLESVLTGLRMACVVVGSDMSIRVWKSKAEELWGLRAEEVEGRSLMGLDIGLPVEELEGMIQACLRGETDLPPQTFDAINRRGQRFGCLVYASPLLDFSGTARGAILLMEPSDAGPRTESTSS